MRKILNKFKPHDHLDVDGKYVLYHSIPTPLIMKTDSSNENITIQQVFHYRKQKGVNLGTHTKLVISFPKPNQTPLIRLLVRA
jgi:hypothetical protein